MSATATKASPLEVRDLKKSFGGVPVLKGVTLILEPGTVTALSGENGAGKSVLMKIASGLYQPDSGDVLVAGESVPHGDPGAALRHGVAIVPQELAFVPEMTVYENLFLGREIKRGPMLDRKAMAEQAGQMLADFGVKIDPRARMGSLSVGLCQLVEIVKNTSKGAKVVLLDEPSSAISAHEVEHLYATVRRLRDQGVAMVYTTHKMEEIRALADRVVVLRDGVLTLDRPADEITDDEIVTAMIGRELGDLFPELQPAGDRVVLELRDVVVPGAPAPISLNVRAGEIVGLSGLVGAGRTELMETIFGVQRPVSGTVTVDGVAITPGSPKASINGGLAIVPEDRKGSGAVLSMSVGDNGALPRLDMFTVAGFVRRGQRNESVGAAMASVRLKSNGLGQEVGTLSGGNQQKVVLARWLTDEVKVLLLDEPTRGVDVGARSEIYRLITDLAATGMAVVMASSDMPEILSLSHRALVLSGHEVMGELSQAELHAPDAQERLFRLAARLDHAETAPQMGPTTDSVGSDNEPFDADQEKS